MGNNTPSDMLDSFGMSSFVLPEEFKAVFGQMVLKSFMPSKQYTVRSWYEHMMQNKEAGGRSDNTLHGYAYHSVRVMELIGDKQLCEVTPDDITNLLNTLAKEKVQYAPRAQLRDDIDVQTLLNSVPITKTALAKKAGISQSTVDNALQGKHILLTKAEAICGVLGVNYVDVFATILLDKGLSPATLTDYRRFLSVLFGTAKREMQILVNPMEHIEKPTKKGKNAKPKHLQIDEVQQVLSAAENEPINRKIIIHLLFITGCRLGELCGLKWTSVDWKANTLLISQQVQYSPSTGVHEVDSTKTGKDRLIRIPQETMDLLKDYKGWQDCRRAELERKDDWIESDYILTATKGGMISPSTVANYIKRFYKKYDLPPIHAHMFRHTHASILIHSGMDVATVSKRLGHLDVSTTLDYYSHLLIQADIESADLLSEAIYQGTNQKAHQSKNMKDCSTDA